MEGVYYGTWNDTGVTDPAQHDLANISTHVINLAFCKPDCGYVKGSHKFDLTGLEFGSSFDVIIQAITLAKQAGRKVMLSIGGADYLKNWDNYNPKACFDLAKDLGCSGVDIDWEGTVDQKDKLAQVMADTFKSSGTFLVSMATWSTGAYQPSTNDPYSGIDLDVLKTYGARMPWINVMAYGKFVNS